MTEWATTFPGDLPRRLLSVLGDMPFGALAYTRVPGPRRHIERATAEELGAFLVDWLEALNAILEAHTADDRARDMKLTGYEAALRGVGALIQDAQALLERDRRTADVDEERRQDTVRGAVARLEGLREGPRAGGPGGYGGHHAPEGRDSDPEPGESTPGPGGRASA